MVDVGAVVEATVGIEVLTSFDGLTHCGVVSEPCSKVGFEIVEAVPVFADVIYGGVVVSGLQDDTGVEDPNDDVVVVNEALVMVFVAFGITE